MFFKNNIDFSNALKWEEALQKKILTNHQITLFNELKNIRNEQVHSLPIEINLTKISYGIEIANELRTSLEKEMKDKILNFFKENPTEVFAARAIGHIFSISKSYASHLIETLEEEGEIISGIEEESGITFFQIG
ncbi:hypothetical protein [Nonlabens xylanidelens]|uniref:hypothetical protein n=1 Tax=Nonlabens xylanidelens TaxID=191564 RepID=UPI000CEC653C|nr:hypothetical protein [Nonlabens xylanidelens]PQJ17468.1 hypothetical protein BST94_10435 [Nonlabens xylanidelens]